MARLVAILKLVRLDLEKLTIIPSPEIGPKWAELVNNSGDTLVLLFLVSLAWGPNTRGKNRGRAQIGGDKGVGRRKSEWAGICYERKTEKTGNSNDVLGREGKKAREKKMNAVCQFVEIILASFE